MAVVVVSGRLPPAARRRAAPAIAIASETGTLVETEEERAREVQSWKTNLLRQRRPDPNARVLDPRVIPRQYSKEELNALAVPAQRIATHHLPPLHNLKADAVTIAAEAASSSVASVVMKGMEEALELESQLLDKMSLTVGEEGGAVTYRPLASIASSVSIAMGDLGGVVNEPHPFTPLAINLATPAIAPVPIKDALQMMTELADAAAQAKAKGAAPISPSERQAKLRRYKTGLSPMQKVKNMLDDIVGRIHSADKGTRPVAPLPLAEELRRRRRGGGGPAATVVEAAAGDVETTKDKSKSGMKQEHVIRIAAPQSKVAAAADVTDSLTQGANAEQEEQNEDQALLYGGGRLEDEEVLSMQDSNLSFSLTYASDPLDTLSPGAAIPPWASPRGLDDEDPRSIFSADGTLKDSAFQESVQLSPLSPRFVHAAQVTRNKVAIVKMSRGESRAAKNSKSPVVNKTLVAPINDEATLNFGIKCSKCTCGGKLWCGSCKLAFCFKCWGLVDHHKPVDSVRVMNEERLARAAAAGAVPEADTESELDDASDAKGKGNNKAAKATFKVYTEARCFKLPPKPASEVMKMAPAPLSFDERNASHFAAEKRDPERAALLQHLKVKRLAETSERMKNHYAFVRSHSHKVVKMAEQRREDVHERLDHKTRMKAIEQQMIRELEQESLTSQGIGGVVLGKPSDKQIAAESFVGRSKSRSKSRSRSPDWRRPDWRSQRIASPDELLRQREEEIRALRDDPVDGWGWSVMPAKASKNENFAQLPFSEPLKDQSFLVPDHLRDQLASQPRVRGRGKKVTSAQARVEKIVSLW